LAKANRMTLPVVWLLFHYSRVKITHHGRNASAAYNTCGFIRCVNPDHWHHITPEERRQRRTPVVVTYDGDTPVVRTVKQINEDAARRR